MADANATTKTRRHEGTTDRSAGLRVFVNFVVYCRLPCTPTSTTFSPISNAASCWLASADPVSPDLEIAAVIDRACKSPGGGPALLFEKPTGFDMPVAANVYGSMERMCLALGVKTLDDLAQEIEELMTPQMPEGIMDALKMLPMVGRLRDLMPKTVKDAPCQEIVQRDGTLDELPILTCWPDDGGPYITFPLVFTKDPGVRRAQHRHLPDAGVRRPHDRACTGSGTRAARSITAWPSGWASGSRSRWRSARSRCCRTARRRRCRKGSTSCCSAGFSRAAGSSSSSA